VNSILRFVIPATLLFLSSGPHASAQGNGPNQIFYNGIQRVLLISIDGMHSLDYMNCSKGVNGGTPYCPNLASLAQTGIYYPNAFTTKPSDSFPGSAGLATGGTPRTTGFFYDVSYDRSLSPPAATTPYGIVGGAGLCPGTVGTQVGFDEEIDFDLTRIDGGGGINPAYLPRDPKNGCAPVYPHSYLRVNTMFEVVKASGGYTAWSDKHPAYDFYQGPSGSGVSDFYSPEINSTVVGLPSVPGCTAVVDKAADLTAWTNSFQNIQCYDSLKVQTVINWIDGLWHDGSRATQIPSLFGMNFQAVSVGQKLVQNGVTGGYLDSTGTPSPSLLSEIQFVDRSIGKMITELKNQGLYSSTLFVITAKHGQSPIDPVSVLRIPADDSSLKSPGAILGNIVAQASQDDISLIWLADQTKTASAVKTLSANAATIGVGEIFSGNAIALMFNDPAVDPRVPDIIMTPKLGVVYTGGKKKVSEHGGFSSDATNVILLVSNSQLTPATIGVQVQTTQVAPTIVNMLRIRPSNLNSVVQEGTQILPGLAALNPFGN
jgi:Type I phosphodiesterase / nucleotide pyrophosphatase